MLRERTLWITAATVGTVLLGSTLTGCATPNYSYTHRIDPHAGRENEAAMSAVGSLIRPHSKLGPAETEQRLEGLRGLGTLMDIMSR